jgi:hypothetical protein
VFVSAGVAASSSDVIDERPVDIGLVRRRYVVNSGTYGLTD